jgi:hypothetical protein
MTHPMSVKKDDLALWLSPTKLLFLGGSVREAWEATHINDEEFKARTGYGGKQVMSLDLQIDPLPPNPNRRPPARTGRTNSKVENAGAACDYRVAEA